MWNDSILTHILFVVCNMAALSCLLGILSETPNAYFIDYYVYNFWMCTSYWTIMQT